MAAAALAAPDTERDRAEVEPGLETVTVYSLRPTAVTRVAAAVSVIDQADIGRNLATDIKQLVRYEPGVVVRNDPFRFGLGSFAVRGLGGSRVRVEIDGIPAATGFAVGAYADTGRRFIDLAFIDRLEILRGPASSLYGSDALGGVVAIRTLRPATLLEEADAPWAGRAQLGYQGADQGWHAAAIGAAEAGPGTLLLGYVRREGRAADTAADVKPDPRRYVADSAMFTYQLDGMPGGPLRLSAEGGRVRQRTAVDAFIGAPGRFVDTIALAADDEGSRHRVSLDQSVAALAGFDSLDWRLYWQGTDTRQDSYETRRATPRTPPLQVDRQFRFAESTVGIEASAARSREYRGSMHEFVIGIEALRRRVRERRDGIETNLLSGTTSKTILGETLPMRDLPVTDLTEIGAFAQDEIDLGTSRWSLIPALRVDYYGLEPRPDELYRAGNPAAEALSLRHVSLAPKLGITYRLSDTTSAFFQYAHGFRSPPPEDVNIGFYIPQFNYRALPNPDLRPERSDGYELGLRWRRPLLELSGSLYYNDYRDFIESRVNIGVDAATGATQFQSRNVSSARIRGAEVALSARAPAQSRLDGWSLKLAGSWSQGRDLTRDRPLNSVAPANGVLSVRYDARSGRWGSELAAVAVAPKRDIDRSLANLYGTAGYATLDWRANFDLGHGVQVDAGAFNLTDRAYIEWEDVRGRASGDPLLPYYTRPGRNVSMSLRWEF